MMANKMVEANVGELAERRRDRQKWILIGLSLVGAALQIGIALMRSGDAGPQAVPTWLTILSAAVLGALLIQVFRLGDRITDEFKQRQIATVAIAMMKALLIGYPVWLLLEQGGLVPELSAIVLFGALVAVMFSSLLWCRLKG